MGDPGQSKIFPAAHEGGCYQNRWQLIKSIATDANTIKATQGIVEFAHRLAISAVAEFVHNAEVQQQVERLGIDFSQGAYLECLRLVSVHSKTS